MRFDVVRDNLPLLLSGLAVTLQVAVGAILLGIALGLVTGVARMSALAPVRWLAGLYVEVIRNTPALVQVFVIYYGLGEFRIRLPAFAALVLALGINNGAYLAEIFRGGLQSVRRGQLEAAAAIGLPGWTALSHVVLPQAVRSIYPAVTNQSIQIVLATSLGTIVGLPELTNQTLFIDSRTFRTTELLITVTLMYAALTLGISIVARLVGWRLDRAYQ
jgi:polar amino acid transport system permease protein